MATEGNDVENLKRKYRSFLEDQRFDGKYAERIRSCVKDGRLVNHEFSMICQ